MRRKLLRIGIRLLGPALLVAVLLRIEDPSALGATLRGASPLLLALAVALNSLNLHCKVLRWQALLRTRGVSYPLGRAWKAFLASVYLGMLTPGRVGDVLRIQYVRRDVGMPYAEGLAVVVMDRFCDIYVLLGFVAIGVARLATVLSGALAYVTWGGVAVVALAPVLLFVPGLAERLMGALYGRLTKGREPAGLHRFLVALRAQVGRSLWWAVALTVVAFLVNYLQGWIMGRALGLSLAFLDVVSLMAIITLLSLLPISVSGVGVRELFLALVFPALGLRPQQGVAFGLMNFFVIYLMVTLAGAVAWQLAPPPVGDAADR
ncbi:MAG: flippase-like domain-containing protein [Deltaproteobacteria bacterium]|nr:flippase-like domain-containing protein [Deltaproteobacteria bacterium]